MNMLFYHVLLEAILYQGNPLDLNNTLLNCPQYLENLVCQDFVLQSIDMNFLFLAADEVDTGLWNPGEPNNFRKLGEDVAALGYNKTRKRWGLNDVTPKNNPKYTLAFGYICEKAGKYPSTIKLA